MDERGRRGRPWEGDTKCLFAFPLPPLLSLTRPSPLSLFPYGGAPLSHTPFFALSLAHGRRRRGKPIGKRSPNSSTKKLLKELLELHLSGAVVVPGKHDFPTCSSKLRQARILPRRCFFSFLCPAIIYSPPHSQLLLSRPSSICGKVPCRPTKEGGGAPPTATTKDKRT